MNQNAIFFKYFLGIMSSFYHHLLSLHVHCSVLCSYVGTFCCYHVSFALERTTDSVCTCCEYTCTKWDVLCLESYCCDGSKVLFGSTKSHCKVSEVGSPVFSFLSSTRIDSPKRSWRLTSCSACCAVWLSTTETSSTCRFHWLSSRSCCESNPHWTTWESSTPPGQSKITLWPFGPVKLSMSQVSTASHCCVILLWKPAAALCATVRWTWFILSKNIVFPACCRNCWRRILLKSKTWDLPSV